MEKEVLIMKLHELLIKEYAKASKKKDDLSKVWILDLNGHLFKYHWRDFYVDGKPNKVMKDISKLEVSVHFHTIISREDYLKKEFSVEKNITKEMEIAKTREIPTLPNIRKMSIQKIEKNKKKNTNQKKKASLKGNVNKQDKRSKEILNASKDDTVELYVDGSYMPIVEVGAYGYVAYLNNKRINKDFGIVLNSEMLELGSTGAELTAFLRGIEWCIANGYKTARVHYDCHSVIDLLSKKNLKNGEEYFVRSFKLYSEQIKILTRKTNSNLDEKHLEAHDLSRVAGYLIKAKKDDK